MKTPGVPLNEIMDLNEEDKQYLRGSENWFIRMYFYLENGLNIFNSFRNLGFLIIALYLALHLDGAWGIFWAAMMIPPFAVILVLVGRYNVHTLSKMKEWLSMRFSTHYGIKNFNYQQEQTILLREIKELLSKQNEKIT